MENKLMTIREAAQLLGIRERTLYQWSWLRRSLPFVKVGKSLRIREKDLVAFIEKNTRNPTKERTEK